ncbi:MAG: outer membrane beta-barrel protein [Akkermansiaceae bacterium]
MNKKIITGSLLLASIGAATAQGLYDIAPDYRATESSPIKWTAGLSFGVDDNVTPSQNNDDTVTYAHAYIGAAMTSISPQTKITASGTLGGRVYLDEPEATGDDLVAQSKISLNVAHAVSDRLRLTTNNFIGYESEPDYENGLASEGSEYLHYNTSNAVGYRWTERLGTYSGFSVNAVDYDDIGNRNDRLAYSVFNNFRYNLSSQDILTFNYRYQWRESSGSARDSTNQFITLGLERRLDENSILTVKAGVQLRDVDGGTSSDTPYLEAALRKQMNEQFSIRSFVKYSIEDYGTSLGSTARYDTSTTLRIGVTGNYIVSPDLTLTGGLNFISTDNEDGVAVSDSDQELFNVFVGFAYEMNDGVFFTGTYNFTDSSSDLVARDYERNRASLGVRVKF